ncbi:DUF1206 domain-containing protein [Desertihabitans brevis]|uniref:DUF1206 domain-containing protein n=1 Tax=Desertihabitans brevis TaxID=2268447 RepID=A0A367YS65_9ACTN|nr:DUF1206 domain-containing protein [Desertihabitans brevis]RCK68597.1 DUF1206 domain-containing protein [Desertihabitans brevis]
MGIDEATGGVREKADEAQDAAQDAGRAIQDNPLYRWLVTVGLVAYGVVHLLVAWLAVQLTFGGSQEQASNTGAMQELAEQPFGGIMLVVVAVGLLTLSLWQLLEAALGHLDRTDLERVRKRLSSLGRAVLYAALGVSALLTALGSGGGGGGAEKSLTGRLLGHPAGVVMVLLGAAAIAAVAVAMGLKGVRRKFREDLRGDPGTVGTVLGVLGHVAKAIAFLVVASLFVAAAVTHDPNRAGGLDVAFKAVRDQPFGVVLLLLMAFGVACYGLYCFFWARRPAHG